MASWGKNRSGRHLSIAVPPEIKIQLIKNKATTGVGIGYQICEALKTQWGTRNGPPAVVPNPAPGTLTKVEAGRYKGMRSQPIDRTNIPWKV